MDDLRKGDILIHKTIHTEYKVVDVIDEGAFIVQHEGTAFFATTSRLERDFELERKEPSEAQEELSSLGFIRMQEWSFDGRDGVVEVSLLVDKRGFETLHKLERDSEVEQEVERIERQIEDYEMTIKRHEKSIDKLYEEIRNVRGGTVK